MGVMIALRICYQAATMRRQISGTRHGRRPARPPSTDPRSPHYDAEVLERDVGVRFKGVEKTNVAEYCVSEGWIRVEAGKTKDRYGNPLTIKLTGPVEAYFRDEKKA